MLMMMLVMMLVTVLVMMLMMMLMFMMMPTTVFVTMISHIILDFVFWVQRYDKGYATWLQK